MPNVNDNTSVDEVSERRADVGQWLTEQIDMQGINRKALVKILGVSATRLAELEAGAAELTLDQANALDRQLGMPPGATAAAGGYVSFFTEPDLAGESIFDTREIEDEYKMLEALRAAVDLGLGVRLRNEWRVIHVDERGTETAEGWWVLDLMSHAPTRDSAI